MKNSVYEPTGPQGRRLSLLSVAGSDQEYFYPPHPPFSHLDGTPLHPRVNPEVNLPGPIYTLGWRETLNTLRVNCLAEDTAQCPRSGLEKE